MISIDQILLLEKKVESAVNRIAELNAKVTQLAGENDALRRKCAELTNALSAKTEFISSFQTDQKKIEEGIIFALDRLNTVENAIYSTGVQTEPAAPVVPETPAGSLSEAPAQKAPLTPPPAIETVPASEQETDLFGNPVVPQQPVTEETEAVPETVPAVPQEPAVQIPEVPAEKTAEQKPTETFSGIDSKPFDIF